MVIDTSRPKYNIDAAKYYQSINFNPLLNFNKIEITLSHLLRKKMSFLGNRNYSDCLYDFLSDNKIFPLSAANIIEVGAGLGDVALNLVKRLGKEQANFEYKCYDISPNLCDYQNSRLNEYEVFSECCNALNLHEAVEGHDGLILCNGMIADLRSVYISNEASLYDLKIDRTWFDLIERLKRNRGVDNFYFHVGTLELLDVLYQACSDSATVIISEYKSNKYNQPADFGTHYECGIDFYQIIDYASQLGFKHELFSVEDILGPEIMSRFLTMDIFTKDWNILMGRMPALYKIFKSGKILPVLAYTPHTLKQTLVNDQYNLESIDIDKIIESLEGQFATIDDYPFDTKNPYTWRYQYLILQKRPFNKQILKRAVADTMCQHFGLDIAEIAILEGQVDTVLKMKKRSVGPESTEIVRNIVENLKEMGILYYILYDFGKALYDAALKDTAKRVVEKIKATIRKYTAEGYITNDSRFDNIEESLKDNLLKRKAGGENDRD